MPPQRQLGFLSALALVVASMIGSGVFTTSGFLLADLHSPVRVLAAWLGGGVLAMLGALCYGALARRFPESGGEYLFLAKTLHPAAGYLAGWVSLLVGFSAPLAAVARAGGGLAAVFVSAAPAEQLAGKLEVGRIAAEALGGRALANFVTALIILALATSLSSMMMAGPRVYARMADDGCLPRWLRFPALGPPR